MANSNQNNKYLILNFYLEFLYKFRIENGKSFVIVREYLTSQIF